MKRNVRLIGLITLMAVSVCGCKDKEAETPKETTMARIEIIQDEGTSQGETASEEETGGTFSFANLKGQEFLFSSGAGGWGTTLMIYEDGSFSGLYSDSDMGAVGEGYPNGRMAWSDFKGRFTQPVKIDDYTYSMEMTSLEYADEVGTEEIKDGVLYSYTDVYGLEGATDILLHLPGTPLEALSEEVRMWIGYYDLSYTSDTELPFYVLENPAEGCSFKSYDVADNLRKRLAWTEEQSLSLETSLQNDPLTQLEMNEMSKELYDLWDLALNAVWGDLKKILDEDAMGRLTLEERAWIAEKEQAVAEAGAGSEGGSIQPLIMNQKAAEMTRDRVYELMDMFE